MLSSIKLIFEDWLRFWDLPTYRSAEQDRARLGRLAYCCYLSKRGYTKEYKARFRWKFCFPAMVRRWVWPMVPPSNLRIPSGCARKSDSAAPLEGRGVPGSGTNRAQPQVSLPPTEAGSALAEASWRIPITCQETFTSGWSVLIVKRLFSISACYDRLSELADHRQLVTKITIQGAEIVRQRDRRIALAVGDGLATIDVHQVRRFDGGMGEILVGRVERVVDHE